MGQHETPGNDVDTRMAGILERMKKREQAAANADRKVIVVSDPNNCPLSVKTSCDCCKDGEYIDIQYNPEIAIYAYQTRECYRKMLDSIHKTRTPPDRSPREFSDF
jgi:hypothetical protein